MPPPIPPPSPPSPSRPPRPPTSLRVGPLVDELRLQAGVERLSELRLRDTLALIRVRTPRQWLAKGVVRLPLRLAHSLAQLHNNNELAQLAAAQRDAAEG